MHIQCLMPASFTWESAYARLCEMQNSDSRYYKNHPLSTLQLQAIGKMIEDSLALPLTEILSLYDIHIAQSREVCLQVTERLPLWRLHSSQNDVIVNCYELVMTPGTLES